LRLAFFIRQIWFTLKFDIADVALFISGKGVRREIVSEIPIAPSMIVDMLTGTGSILIEYAQAFPNAFIYAVDSDPKALSFVSDRLTDRGISRFQTIVGDAKDVKLPEGKADLVNISFGLHELCFEDRRKVLLEAMRLLKTNGFLIVSDYRMPEGRGKGILARIFFRLFEPPWISEVLKGDIKDAIQEAGFMLEREYDLPLTSLFIARNP